MLLVLQLCNCFQPPSYKISHNLETQKHIESYNISALEQSSKFKILSYGDGELAQQLRAPIALTEDPGSVLSTHMAAHNRL